MQNTAKTWEDKHSATALHCLGGLRRCFFCFCFVLFFSVAWLFITLCLFIWLVYFCGQQSILSFCIIRLNVLFPWIHNNGMVCQLTPTKDHVQTLSFCAFICFYQISRTGTRFPQEKQIISKLKQSLCLFGGISTKAMSACLFKTAQMRDEQMGYIAHRPWWIISSLQICYINEQKVLN